MVPMVYSQGFRRPQVHGPLGRRAGEHKKGQRRSICAKHWTGERAAGELLTSEASSYCIICHGTSKFNQNYHLLFNLLPANLFCCLSQTQTMLKKNNSASIYT